MALLTLVSIIFVTLGSCSDDSDSGSSGYAPRNISGKTLVLKKSSGSVYLSTDHLNESGVLINNVTVNYSKYAPSYTYTKTGDDEADYYLQATKETYIPYYGTTTYAKFVFNVNLHFITEVSGTYTGVQTMVTETIAESKATLFLTKYS